MVPSAGNVPTNSAVDRAGDLLRDVLLGTRASDSPEVIAAIETVYAFRASFQDAHIHVANVLGEIVADESPESQDDVTGRPKRAVAIYSKLIKQHIRLSQMEDIAGLRARLPDAARVQAVLRRIREQWPDAHVDDYVANPKSSGYRAIHIVVREDGRRVEIQLRTPGQNRWADTVEEWGDRLGYNVPGRNLKDGQGPPELVRYFERAAYRIAVEEAGDELDEAFRSSFEALRERVRPFFRVPDNGESPEDRRGTSEGPRGPRDTGG